MLVHTWLKYNASISEKSDFFQILCAENKCFDRRFCACDSFALCSFKEKQKENSDLRNLLNVTVSSQANDLSSSNFNEQAISMNNQRNTFAILSSILRMCISLEHRIVNKVLYNRQTYLFLDKYINKHCLLRWNSYVNCSKFTSYVLYLNSVMGHSL